MNQIRILFVFAWLVVGGEETEVRLLAKYINPAKYKIDVVACFWKPGMPEQTHKLLKELGTDVDCTPYMLSFEDTVQYLAGKIPAYDLVVACQAVPDVYPALEMLSFPPPLIEHGGLVSEALAGPKHLTARYIGVCESIRAAAASVMPGREHHALMIPSMIDLNGFDAAERQKVRSELGVPEEARLVGWVGRLDRKKRVEDFIEAAAMVHTTHPDVVFVIVGGPDAFMPEYALELQTLSKRTGLLNQLIWLGDRPDISRLMSAMDVFVWLSQGEGMPHVIAEAGAARLPVIATKDNGTAEQIENGRSGLFVPHQHPAVLADAIRYLLDNPTFAKQLGVCLQQKVVNEYSAGTLVKQWEAVFDEVITEKYLNDMSNEKQKNTSGKKNLSDEEKEKPYAENKEKLHTGSDSFTLADISNIAGKISTKQPDEAQQEDL